MKKQQIVLGPMIVWSSFRDEENWISNLHISWFGLSDFVTLYLKWKLQICIPFLALVFLIERNLQKSIVLGMTAAEYINQAFNGQRGFQDGDNCACCGDEKAKKCSACKVVCYCSQVCQKYHRFVHKKFCQKLKG